MYISLLDIAAINKLKDLKRAKKLQELKKCHREYSFIMHLIRDNCDKIWFDDKYQYWAKTIKNKGVFTQIIYRVKFTIDDSINVRDSRS